MSQTADIDTSGLRRCIGTLEAAFAHMQGAGPDGTMRDIFRAACDKQFELVLEIGGSLLRKRLRDFFASNREADRLTFRDAFRHGAKHGLMPAEACERWLQYRDIRNASAHDYGECISPRRRWSSCRRLSPTHKPWPMPSRMRSDG